MLKVALGYKHVVLNCKLHANRSMFQTRIMAWAHANGKTYVLFDCLFCFSVHYVLGYESRGVCFWLFVFHQQA